MKEPKNKTRILLIGDYSNFHATLARGLRSLDCDVTLMSDGGSFMQCGRDIDISRKYSGKFGGLLHATNLWFTTLSKLKGFDIVSFRDPQFLNLKPERIIWFLNRITASNPNCYLSYLSTDIPFLNMLESKNSPLKYSEWFIDGKPNRMFLEEKAKWEGWHAPKMQKLNTLFYSKIKGAVTALYEYHKAAERILPEDKIAYGGIPIDVDAIEHRIIDKPKKVRLFLARDYRRKLEKGNDLLEEAARKIVARYPEKADFVLVENVPRKQYLETMASCHVLLDQIYSYTPATAALESMAAGLTVVSGGEPEYYQFIGEKENFPIVNAPPEYASIEKKIEEVVLHPEYFQQRSIKGREFVKKHNDMTIVAGRFLDFWNKTSSYG